MKLETLLLTPLLSFSICVAQPAANDFTTELNREGGGDEVVQTVRLLPLNQQSQVLQSVVHRIQAISREPQSIKNDSFLYVSNSARLLSETGTDDQILAAFGNLSQFGSAEPDAAFALAACKGPAGVAIIDALAKQRLPNLERAITPLTDDDKLRSNETLLPFFMLVKELAASVNPSGSGLAKQMRDDFASRYSSENGKLVLAAIDAELAKVTSRKSAAVGAPSTSTSTSLPSEKPSPTPKEQEAKSPTPSEAPTSSTPWSLVAVFIVAAIGLLWLLLKNRK